MSIRILPENLVNQIAAGEVVERPSHLVKELLENSLDAGATEIQIEFEEGGKWVQVKDNGAGFSREDLPLAFSRHATSKISESADLWRLQSFGFRGEALASIGAVSSILLSSKHIESDSAYQISCEFGQLSKVQKTGRDVGTSIRMEKLFDNVPARKKFLKSDSAEHSQIKNVIKAMALANPQCSFRAKQGSRWSVYWPKTDQVKKRVELVLDQEALFDCFYESGLWKVQCVVGSPKNVVANSRQIWIFVNGRYVQDRSLQVAVQDAYRSLLMHGEFPIAAIFLQCPPAEVDVNVHPTKSQVKFRDSKTAFRVVHKCIRDLLETAPWVPQMLADSGMSLSSSEFTTPTFGGNSEPPAVGVVNPLSAQTQMESATTAFGGAELERAQFHKRGFEQPAEKKPETSHVPHGYWTQLDLCGQLLNTYMVAQNESNMVLVDQHAAHERVLYEKLMKSWKDGKIDVQSLLIPISVDLDEAMIESIKPYLSGLARCGLEVDIMGPETLGVRAIPSMLKEDAVVEALQKMGEETLNQGQSFSLEKSISEVFSTMSCHSAIRAGKTMSREEMQSLLMQMDEFPMSSFCPHGRPVSIEFTRYELERRFGRIV